MDRIDKDEELVCPLCGGRLFWMPVSHIYACEYCKQSYSERNGVYMKKKRKSTAEKSSAVGDAAKLREALITIRDKAHEQYVNDYGIDTVWIQDVANAALAAPPRNCDKVKTSWDVLKKWHEGLDTANAIVRMLDWLLAPATEKEGETKWTNQ